MGNHGPPTISLASSFAHLRKVFVTTVCDESIGNNHLYQRPEPLLKYSRPSSLQGGRSALHYAACSGSDGIVKLLLSKKSDPTLPAGVGRGKLKLK